LAILNTSMDFKYAKKYYTLACFCPKMDLSNVVVIDIVGKSMIALTQLFENVL